MSQSTRPVLGYLTTTWAPPASCLSVNVWGTKPPWPTGYAGVTCASSDAFYDETDCWPPRTANAPNPTEEGAFLTCIWLGITIHNDYRRNGCRMLSKWWIHLLLLASEPRREQHVRPSTDMSPFGDLDSDRGSSLHYRQSSLSAILGSITIYNTYYYRISNFYFYRPDFASLGSIVCGSIKIQINWRAEDVSIATPTPTPTSADSGGNLSGGAIAGIVIGSIFGLAGFAIGLFWFIRRNRLKRKDVSGQSREPDDATARQLSQPVKPQQETQQPYELPMSDSVHELPGREVVDGRFHSELQS
ncbi:hypothetical protein J7T55_001633 [Diaporthe amygdali]|uniref:uncharacterized protein n=1 Tax=Phomopsis amygdali TaxID=1214568 RepID=UPI0022FE4778|nr:uncharacterized protein J7T55_001633 [Diaporthe amygdali]KAJ0115223.1 hypothetical protein J7T55_001633 [Diaporthe amygdali]